MSSTAGVEEPVALFDRGEGKPFNLSGIQLFEQEDLNFKFYIKTRMQIFIALFM